MPIFSAILCHKPSFFPGSCSWCDFCQKVLYVQTPTTKTSRHPYSLYVGWKSSTLVFLHSCSIQSSELLVPPRQPFGLQQVLWPCDVMLKSYRTSRAFALRNWKDSSDWFEKKKHLHFWCVNVRGLCGSIQRNLLFYSIASNIRLTFSRLGL